MKRHYRGIGVLAVILLSAWLALPGGVIAAPAGAAEAGALRSFAVVDGKTGNDEQGEGTALSPYRTIGHALDLSLIHI